MAENLKLYYQNQLAFYQNMRRARSEELSQIGTGLAEAIAQLTALVTAYGEQERTIAATRQAMAAEGLMPADVETLAVELRQLLIDQHAARVALLKVEDQKAVLESARDSVTQGLEEIDSRMVEVDGNLAEAIEQADIHAALVLRVDNGEIADLQARVTDLLAIIDGGPLAPDAETELVSTSDAKARIEADIPEILRNHAQPRGAYLNEQLSRRRTQLMALQQIVVDQQAMDFGVAGVLAQAWLAYEDAVEAYANLVGEGGTRYERALALLSAVPLSAGLTTAENERITAVALAADDDALVKELARDVAQAAVAAKVVEIEDAIANSLITDVDADPEADVTVTIKRGELVALEATLTTAEGEFDAAMQEALAIWQGAVPDAIWANFVNYDRAVVILRELDDVDVAALGVALDDAETSLVDALEAEDQAIRLLNELEARAALLDDRMAGLAGRSDGHLVSAVRGNEGYHTSLVQGEIL